MKYIKATVIFNKPFAAKKKLHLFKNHQSMKGEEFNIYNCEQ